MKKLMMFAALAAFLAGCTAHTVINKQGNFTVGGTVVTRPGTYDNSKFVGWAEQEETGQSYRADHAFVEYQIPARAKKTALVFVHGYGGSGSVWQTTPDGRDGFSTLMLKHRYPVYVMDLPGRGRAGRTTEEKTVKPVADEMFWFDIWRMGIWPEYNTDVQFPEGKEALDQFFRLMTPNLGSGANDAQTVAQTADKTAPAVLVTHSAGGVPGWLAAIQSQNVRGVAAYEPGAFVFPEDDLPPAIDGLTGGTAPIAVSREDFLKLTRIPIVLYFGDYIPEEVSKNLGDENWRVRLQMARKFVEAVNKNGGDATLVELPKTGIYGNTHFLFMEKNNEQLADLLASWLKAKKLS